MAGREQGGDPNRWRSKARRWYVSFCFLAAWGAHHLFRAQKLLLDGLASWLAGCWGAPRWVAIGGQKEDHHQLTVAG